MYLTCGLLFASGAPWKAPVYTNAPLCGFFAVATLFTALIMFVPDRHVFIMQDDVHLSMRWRVRLLFLALGHLVCAAIFERGLLPFSGGCRSRKLAPGLAVAVKVHKTAPDPGEALNGEYHLFDGDDSDRLQLVMDPDDDGEEASFA